MSERISDKMIATKVKRMQDQGMDIGLDGQYGRFRITNKAESRDLSPRGANRMIYDWLFAYEEGYNAGLKSAEPVDDYFGG